MKLYAFALVLCVGLAVGAEVDSVPEVPSDLQLQLDELQLADKPEAPLDDAEQPLPPSGDELPEDAPEPVPEDGSPDEDHPAEEQEQEAEADEEEADESESEESEESDELEEARLVAEELEERQQELDYLKRYLVGRLQAVAILDRRVRPAVIRRPWIRRPWIRRPGVLPRLPVL
uniref:Uncharacterized protein n=1 Tax=Anopheles coluzzii TaxID=1518534 RepID=A0A6E8WB68_ANOCL|nr:rho GTPase-activating protein gacV-like [Anopheles coluzzii]